MKRKATSLLLLILLCSLSGCGAGGEEGQSPFMATFSLGSIVGANEQLLLPGPRVSGGSEAGPSEPFTQTSEVLTVQVDAANTAAFLEALQTGIQDALESSGAELLGGGGSASGGPAGELREPAHFWFSYRQGGIDGIVHVWGVPGTESNLVLIVTIVEG